MSEQPLNAEAREAIVKDVDVVFGTMRKRLFEYLENAIEPPEMAQVVKGHVRAITAFSWDQSRAAIRGDQSPSEAYASTTNGGDHA